MQLNTLTFNRAAGAWGRLCWTDYCYDPPSSGCYGAYFGTIGGSAAEGGVQSPVELGWLEPPASQWSNNGGPLRLVSRGSKGFLAVQVQPDGADGLTLGLATLPTDQRLCAQAAGQAVTGGQVPCSFTPLPACLLATGENATARGYRNRYPRAPDAEGGSEIGPAGFANLQRLGPGGEDAERFLLGWADNVMFQGVAGGNYWVAETDAAGSVGAVQALGATGWGEEDAWVAMEDTGCVAWPFGWAGEDGPGEVYGRMGSPPSELSALMRITVVCLDSFNSNMKTGGGGGSDAVCSGGGDSDGGGGGSVGVGVGVGLTLAAVGLALGVVAVRLRRRRATTGGRALPHEGGVKLTTSI